jgi:hypothetical protein
MNWSSAVILGVVKMGKIADRFANKRNKMVKNKLLGFYWGYNARVINEGFEFNNLTLIGQGIDAKHVALIGNAIYDAAMFQVKGVTKNDPKVLGGQSVSEFLDEEQRRLDWVVEEMKADNYKCPLDTLIHRAMIACCAISTLVSFGRILQDNYNGDSFAHEYKAK